MTTDEHESFVGYKNNITLAVNVIVLYMPTTSVVVNGPECHKYSSRVDKWEFGASIQVCVSTQLHLHVYKTYGRFTCFVL